MKNVKIIDKQNQTDDVLNWIDFQNTIAVDTETTSLDPLTSKILLLQLGTPTDQYVINVHSLGKENTIKILEKVNSPKKTKILQNSMFDYMQIKTDYGIELSNMKCTMLGEQLLTQGKKTIKASLEAIADKYLGVVLDKSVRSSFKDTKVGQEFGEAQLKYAAEDVEHLIPIYNKIQALLNEREMRELSLLEYEAAPVLGDMSLNGVYLDVEKWLPLEIIAKENLEKFEAKLNEHFKEYIEKHTTVDLFGTYAHAINYNSPKQLLPLLRESTGINLASTDAKYLDMFKDSYQVIKDVINYRQEQKKISTYGSNFLEFISKVDNRIHSSFRQLKAQTGRMSSDDPNMMNLPQEQAYRTPFCVQDANWDFISADFSGQELRLLAHASNEEEMIKALQEGTDLHTYSASLIFAKPYDSITKEERNKCKRMTFGLLYGAGPKKLSSQLKVPFKEAKALIDRYFDVFKNVKKLMDDVTAFAKENKYALSPLDKRRVYLDSFDWDNPKSVSHAMNQAKNLPFQGCGASTTKLALVRINNAIKKNDYNARIVNAIHDEILVESDTKHSKEVKTLVETEMIKAFNHYAPSVPMEVNAEVGKHWIH